jgi:hypothetical protein
VLDDPPPPVLEAPPVPVDAVFDIEVLDVPPVPSALPDVWLSPGPQVPRSSQLLLGAQALEPTANAPSAVTTIVAIAARRSNLRRIRTSTPSPRRSDAAQ